MSLHFSVLASGSTGNAFYIGTDQTKLLVDAVSYTHLTLPTKA